MIDSLSAFYAGATEYVERFDAFVRARELIGETLPDHICYKCDSRESFDHMRELFEHESSYIYQTIISGRRIAYIKMKQVIVTALGPIAFLELSDQKPDGSQSDSFDHIEVYPTAYLYDDFIAKLERTDQIVKVERPHHTTHDIEIGGDFRFRCTQEPLIEKIKRSEML